ncbi:hypothetical protein DKX38_001250 [Salix brachista]|uniref:Uncharacterized protein n=1 Tax=Salix brachista TaxID=2182728 RepID=A0A5N5P5K2_9ROSI|nr:hypothetical protein DKX38_001250 [Salix brachista]
MPPTELHNHNPEISISSVTEVPARGKTTTRYDLSSSSVTPNVMEVEDLDATVRGDGSLSQPPASKLSSFSHFVLSNFHKKQSAFVNLLQEEFVEKMSSKSKNVFDAVNHLLSIPEKLMFHPRSNDLENRSNNIPVDILDAPKEYISTWMYLACPSLISWYMTVEDENTLVIKSAGKRKREPQKLDLKPNLYNCSSKALSFGRIAKMSVNMFRKLTVEPSPNFDALRFDRPWQSKRKKRQSNAYPSIKAFDSV